MRVRIAMTTQHCGMLGDFVSWHKSCVVRPTRMQSHPVVQSSIFGGGCNGVMTFVALAVASACASGDQDVTKSSSVQQGPTLHYAYDPLGRLVQAATSDGTGVQYSYDAVGNITSVHRLTAGALRI